MKKYFFRICFLLFCSVNLLQGINSTPTVSRVYGDPFTTAIRVSQPSGPIGELDTTYGDIVGGFPSGSSNVDAQLPGGTAQIMQLLSDGTYFVGSSKSGSHSNVGKYSAQGTLLTTSFGTSGITDLGAATEVVRTMMIDTQNRILVAGGATSGSAGWLKRINTAGSSVTSFITGTSWQYIAAVAQQTTGEVIAVGFNGTHAQIVRYQLDGTVDPSFGTPATPGYTMLNGATVGLVTLPTVTTGLFSVVVDANNFIYIAYSVSGVAYIARFTATGLLDTSFASSGIANISFLNSATSSIYMGIDLFHNLVAAAQVGSNILVTSIASSTGGAASPAFTNATISSSGNTLTIGNIILSSDGGSVGKIFIVGSNSTTIKSRVTRLTNTGILDTSFNSAGTPGYNEFQIGTPSTTSMLLGAALSGDAQLYVAGFQTNSSVTTGYVSRLYNNPNTYQVSLSASTKEQGNIDRTFGQTATETNAGIVTLFYGKYAGALQQAAQDVIELASGKLLVAMNGYSDTAAQSSMILIRLSSDGLLDGSFGTGGQIQLPNLTASNEYITSILEDGSGNIYVTGYSDTQGAILRKYSSSGTFIPGWDVTGTMINVAGYKALAVGLEGDNRVVLFSQTDAVTPTGIISGYDVVTGAIDITFHSAGTPAGYILSTDYVDNVLNMGPSYGAIIDTTGNIYIAYKNNLTGVVDVAGIFNAGPSLISDFGVNGIVSNLFSSASIQAGNINIAFDKNSNIIVAASIGTTMKVAVLNSSDGSLNSSFNGGSILSIPIPNSTSVMLKNVTGVSDGSIMITGYDDGVDDAMLVVRVAADGVLDETFNSQGLNPGILTIQVGDQVANFNARVATGLAIQSYPGANQGNLIVSGYEKQFSSVSTPMILRVFGQPGTTQVNPSPFVVVVPGDFDVSYNSTGIAITYANGASSPTAQQEVKVIRQMIGTNIMTVISDTINSWTTQLLADSSLDTSYGTGGTVAIAKGNGDTVAEAVNGMVFDCAGNLLVFGNNALFGGYIKRILVTGVMDPYFGGYTGASSTLSYPVGTVYGLMSTVYGVAQLSNGNIIIVGNLDNVGTVMMLNSTGIPVTTFGIGGSVANGINMTSVSVDEYDNSYVSIGYVDTDSINKVRIMKIDSTGALVNSYGTNGVVDAAISNIDNYTSIRLVFDEDGKIIVAATYGGSNGKVAVRRFNSDGSVDTTFHGGTQLDVIFPVSTTVQVTSLVALQNGKTLVSGYQYDSVVSDNHDFEFVACIDSSGNMDGSFGSGSTTGLVTFQVASAAQQTRRLYDMNIQTNGALLLAGSESPAVNQQTPLTMRLYGYEDIQAVPQFVGYNPTPAVPSIINPFFNGTGIAFTDMISLLAGGGDVVVNSSNCPILGGYTTDKKFVLARFTTAGILDPSFGGTGIVQTGVIPNLLRGGYITIDSSDRIYIGGITDDFRFVLARFTSVGVLDSSFAGTGIVQSAIFANLSSGGHVKIDLTGRPIIAGMSSDGKLVAARFTAAGSVSAFNASVTVPLLVSGGFVATDTANNVFVSGMTSSGTLCVVKFLAAAGTLDTFFGASGIASTSVIPALSDGGSIGIDENLDIVLGGYTTNQVFVVAKFTSSGVYDHEFGTDTPGIAYSNPVDVLNASKDIAIDNSNRIVIGGYATAYDGSKNMVVARFTPLGVLDTVLSSTGMGTTGTVTGLVQGGFVSVDVFDDIFIAGITASSSLVVAELFSGQEVFVDDPAALGPEEYKIYKYGNNPLLFKNFLAIDLFARFIVDSAARIATTISLNNILDQHALVYGSQPGWNLLQSTYRANDQFDAARVLLIAAHSSSTADINRCFDEFNARRAVFFKM